MYPVTYSVDSCINLLQLNAENAPHVKRTIMYLTEKLRKELWQDPQVISTIERILETKDSIMFKMLRPFVFPTVSDREIVLAFLLTHSP